VGLAAGFDAVGQGACQVGQRVDGGLPGAQDVTYCALARVLAVDVGFKVGLLAAEPRPAGPWAAKGAEFRI
jgi:hypothetical protein